MATDTVNPTVLLEKTGRYLSADDLVKIRSAFDFAVQAHAGQFRKSGESYIVHPLATAETLADYRLDATALIAALLHDVPEDTAITLGQVRTTFGDEVANLVDGVTKLSQVRLKKTWLASYNEETHTEATGNISFETFERHVETLRKMFLAMSKDIRVILIKLADRLHNMRTLDALPPEKQRRIAQETLQVYAPLANRLGIGQLKGELEDLAFPYAFPEEYRWVYQLAGAEIEKRRKHTERVRRVLLKRLIAQGIRADAHARVKHIYSLWRKLLRHDRDMSKIYDLVASRVVVPTVEECYLVMGLIHQMWRPLPGRIKDYIAMPKPNGYQSLHTTVFALGGGITEIQIRTPEMHHWAEYGVAAHWAYKEGRAGAPTPSPDAHRLPKKMTWIEELARLEQTLNDPTEWQKGAALDFFEDRIFVLTPHGDVLDLPVEATPVDFAFGVHSDLGRQCVGAKVNGKIVPLSHPLQNGDIVEILLSKRAIPKRDWLGFTKTHKARSHIKRTIHVAGDDSTERTRR